MIRAAREGGDVALEQSQTRRRIDGRWIADGPGEADEDTRRGGDKGRDGRSDARPERRRRRRRALPYLLISPLPPRACSPSPWALDYARRYAQRGYSPSFLSPTTPSRPRRGHFRRDDTSTSSPSVSSSSFSFSRSSPAPGPVLDVDSILCILAPSAPVHDGRLCGATAVSWLSIRLSLVNSLSSSLWAGSFARRTASGQCGSEGES
ncbi:hypothetical protein BD414DRAFT_44431 [Trametes punicea]|nr:hypothetical protein BD414DRAFT_44431 [Trametes punicea]